ncbi:MAG: hypothetical protein J5706_01450 [Elusimicrobiales bacterium]|nr:hypothetical protein [Elusimicrobiales bacterium]
MELATLAELSKWMEQTDLEEITLRQGNDKISFKAGNDCEETVIPQQSEIKIISAPSIGIFRFALPGRSKSIAAGDKINKGDEIGWMETGNAREAVISQYTGHIKIIAVKDGQPAEYGQPLFFIEPK